MNQSYIRLIRAIRKLDFYPQWSKSSMAARLDLIGILSNYEFFVGKDESGEPCTINLYDNLFGWLDPKFKTLPNISVDSLAKLPEELDTLDFVSIAAQVLSLKSVNFCRFRSRLDRYVFKRCKYRDVLMIGLSFGKYHSVFTYQMWEVSDDEYSDYVANSHDIIKEVIIHLWRMNPTSHDVHNLRLVFNRLAPGPRKLIEYKA